MRTKLMYSKKRERVTRAKRARAARVISRVGLLAALSSLMIPLGASPALANSSSRNVALIPAAIPISALNPNGILPTSLNVTGKPAELFSHFSFSDVPIADITPTKLAGFDTVVLNEVHSTSLSPAAKLALSQFVAGGGKLLIHDADNVTGNDYSWLLGGPDTTRVAYGCVNCGSQSGSTTVTANSGLISSKPTDPSYVNLGQLYQFTDQGDSNLLTSTDPRWFTLARGTNAQGDKGSQIAFATNHNGLIVYNGFDTDFIKAKATDQFRCDSPKMRFTCPPPPAPQPTVDWLAHMWYSELTIGWGPSAPAGGPGSGLPSTQRVFDVGTPIAPSAAGLPGSATPLGTVRACVARTSLWLRLSRFTHVRHRKVVQVDVYVNRHHVARERRPFNNRRLRHLPKKGKYLVRVVGTTNRGFHVIAKQYYHGC